VQQPGLFDAPPRLFTCTPSKLGAYEDCPRRYRFGYVDRPSPPKGPPWAHNSLGASVHTALKNWYALPPERRTPAAACAGRPAELRGPGLPQLPMLLKATWVSEGYRDPEQERSAFRRALGWLEAYLAEADPREEPVGVERTVAARTQTLALSGRVDRIDRRGAQLVIVDYKTGRGELGSDDARGSRALALYAYAAEGTFRRECRTVELHHLPTGTVAAHEHTPESLARHLRRAEDTARDIVAAEQSLAAGGPVDEAFPPRSGPWCGWCDFRRNCAEGSAAAPAKEPWGGLAAD
jgi:RecB family exonuclease